MPQLNQLADVAWSQFFWLLVVIAVIYVGIGKAMLPKIMATVEQRGARVGADLAAAEAARAEADSVEEAYRARMADSRAAAQNVTAAARQESARATESRVRSADEGLRARIEEAEAQLADKARTALAEVESAAAEAARDIVAKLAGVTVTPQDAADAVKAAAHG